MSYQGDEEALSWKEVWSEDDPPQDKKEALPRGEDISPSKNDDIPLNNVNNGSPKNFPSNAGTDASGVSTRNPTGNIPPLNNSISTAGVFAPYVHPMPTGNQTGNVPASRGHANGHNSNAAGNISASNGTAGSFAPYVNTNPSSNIQGPTNAPNLMTNGPWNRFTSYSAPMSLSDKKYLPDSYSFLAIHGPMDKKLGRNFFVFGLLPFIFQAVFLILLMWSVMDKKRGTVEDTDNPDSEDEGLKAFFAQFIPANSSPIVRYTQVTSIAAYLVFPDSSVKDVVRAVQMFPRSSEVQPGDRTRCMQFSCLLRGIQGVLAIFAALLLVITSYTVVDIILNFTAMNFISNLDEAAFFLALSGEFGPVLKTEAEKIQTTDLPPCMYKSKKHYYYRMVVGVIAVIFFAMLTFVIIAQESNNLWVTRSFRVQLQDDTLTEYSGCFEINDRWIHFQRHTYNSFEKGIGNTSFGYCREERQWILFQGNEDGFDPCDAKDNDVELARSSKTDKFDISTSFSESWVSSSNTPLDLYFVESQDGLHCELFLDDGVCDVSFNQPGYQYDGGDCCASTCTQSNCGRGASEIFGNTNVLGTNFPNCTNPVMVPITIQLNSIENSRSSEFVKASDLQLSQYTVDLEDPESAELWRNEKPPVNPYFALDCDGNNVLTVYLDPSMASHAETVMVEDGASCSLVVRNTTSIKGEISDLSNYELSPATESDIVNPDPIWLVNYTIFHENRNEKIKILTQHSFISRVESFRRTPNCYLRKLEDHVDLGSIYTASKPSNEAIHWLKGDGTGNSDCEGENFLERYALSTMFIGMNASELMSTDRQCTWPAITCREGQVIAMQLQESELMGDIPSEIGLLSSLEVLQSRKLTIIH